MSMLTSLTSVASASCIVWSLAACSSGPPKPAVPDGLHRVPVNRLPPVPDGATEVPHAEHATPPLVPDLPAAPDVGDRS
jgi:hypothetical protein